MADLEVPGDSTVYPQVWPGHPPVPTWETPMYRIGRRGINLVAPLDAIEIEGLSRMLNVLSQFGGPLLTRLGQTALATTAAGQRVHTLFRLNDPANTTFTRLAGSNTDLYRGQSGALTLIDSNYSGDPLTFQAVSMNLGNNPFVFIGDRSRNRKVDRTNAVSLIGLPPGGLISQILQAQSSLSICTFDAGDTHGSSAAANWTMTAGQDRAGNAVAAPTAADVLGAGDLLVQVTTNPAGAAADTGYDSIISIPRTSLNMTTFGGGVDIRDDDLIHLRINCSDPSVLEEIKIYFVCSGFTPGAVPGNSSANTEAWFKAIRPNDFQDLHNREISSTDAASDFRTNELLNQFAVDVDRPNPRTSKPQTVVKGITESSRTTTPTFPAGKNVWGEWGVLGIPLRRGDFSRVGNPQVGANSWDTVYGIVIVIQTSTNQPITITFADWSVDGGGNPDVSDPEARAYDYRVRSRHLKTGTKGNPSAVQAESLWLNPIRQKVLVTPNAAFAPPSADVVQDLFRRGGLAATTTDWFYVASNTSDGGLITDDSSDETALGEETLEIDNDQPVTSVSAAGATIRNQVMPVYFMVEDYCFALGDPNQPGRLYRSKQGYPEQWPPDQQQDVCAASEELMNGGVVANAGFCFSRTRMYSILLNADGSFTTEPTGCNEGMVGRWALCVTPFGIAFVSPFGVRITQGSAPDDLSAGQIGPLFQGQTVRGLNPINLTVPTALRLEYYNYELWFTYQDSGGVRRQLIYNFLDKTWRPYLFGTPVCVAYSEPIQGGPGSLLLGSESAGAAFTHSGFTDAGTPIAYLARTGAWDYGQPRNEKLIAEVILDADLVTGAVVTLTPYLNDDLIAVTPNTATGTTGLRRYYFEPFGTVPQHVRTVSLEFSGDAPSSAQLVFNRVGVTNQLQPEITYREPTPWEELPGGEGYCFGLMLTCDTAGRDKTVAVEYTISNSAILTAATLIVNAAGRRKLPFTWPTVLAHQIRIRPTVECEPWMRFKLEWLTDPEPPRVTGWDTNWQSFGTLADKWVKGVIIEADTFNAQKTVVLDVDQTLAAIAIPTTPFNGRTVQQIAVPKVRGRLWRLRATDSNPGKLFRWRPIFDEEPLALTRWQTEERPHEGLAGRWQKPLETFLTLRSSAATMLRVTSFGNAGATLDTSVYTIPSTGDTKQKVRVPFNAAKGMLFEYFMSSTSGFYVYREESEILVEDWSSGQAKWTAFFPSNDDLDPARAMGDAISAAQTPGGA